MTVNTSIRPVLVKMKPDESQFWDISRAVSVRQTCSSLSLIGDMKFTTKQVNQLGLIEVKRIS